MKILLELDSTRSLVSVIRTCKALCAIFERQSHYLIIRIIENQIPRTFWRLLLKLLESEWVVKPWLGPRDVILSDHTPYESVPFPSNPIKLEEIHPLLTPQSSTFIFDQYAAATSLCNTFIQDTIPLFNKRLKLSHPPQASDSEKTVILYAILRYQMILCARRIEGYSHIDEQIVCIYRFLSRMVRMGKPNVRILYTVSAQLTNA